MSEPERHILERRSLARMAKAMAVYSTKRAAEVLKVRVERVRELARQTGAGMRVSGAYRFAWGDIQMMRMFLGQTKQGDVRLKGRGIIVTPGDDLAGTLGAASHRTVPQTTA